MAENFHQTVVMKEKSKKTDPCWRLQAAVGAAGAGYFECAADFSEGSVDSRCLDLVGMSETPEASLKATIAVWATRVHPDDRRRVAERYRDFVEQRAPEFVQEFRFRTGQEKWRRIRIAARSTEREENGRVRAFAGLAFDVTDQKQVEESLRESSAYYRSLIDAGMDMLIVINPAGSITDVNTAAEKLTGYTRSRLVGSEFMNYFEDPAKAKELYDAALRTGSICDVELALRHRNGGITPLLCNVAVFRDENGRVGGVFCIGRDMTEHKREEDVLRLGEERMQLALDAVNDGVWDWKIASDQFFLNPRYYTMLGYEPNEFPGEFDAWKDMIHPDDVEVALRLIHDHLHANSGSYSAEYRLRTKSGEWRWIQGRGRVVEWDADGNPIRMIGIHTDISTRKRAEEELQQSEQRYKKLIAAVTDYIYTVHVENGRAVETIHGPNCVAVTGYTSADFAHDKFLWYQMVEEDDRWIVIEHATFLLEGKNVPPLEHRILRKDGVVRWVRNTPVLHFDRDGNLTSYDGLIRDITEQKEVEEKLLMLQAAIDRSAEAVLWIQPDGRISYANDTACRYLGYSRDEIVQCTISDIDPTYSNDRWGEHWMKRRIERSSTFQSVHRRKDGTPLPVEITADYVNYGGKEYDFAFVRITPSSNGLSASWDSKEGSGDHE
jgi:PAS domain S-box-containing protein